MIGHNYILNEFGENALPKIGWALDNFGHSQTNARILSELGYDGLVFSRSDRNEKKFKRKSKELEFIWHPTEATEIFTHIMTYHYQGPNVLLT